MLRKTANNNNSNLDDRSIDSNSSFFTNGDTIGIEVKSTKTTTTTTPKMSMSIDNRSSSAKNRKFKGGSTMRTTTTKSTSSSSSMKRPNIPQSKSDSDLSIISSSSKKSSGFGFSSTTQADLLDLDETEQKVHSFSFMDFTTKVRKIVSTISTVNLMLMTVILLLMIMILGNPSGKSSSSSGSSSGSNSYYPEMYSQQQGGYQNEHIYRAKSGYNGEQEDDFANYKNVYSEWENRKVQQQQQQQQQQQSDTYGNLQQYAPERKPEPAYDRGEIGLTEPPPSDEVAYAISALYKETNSRSGSGSGIGIQNDNVNNYPYHDPVLDAQRMQSQSQFQGHQQQQQQMLPYPQQQQQQLQMQEANVPVPQDRLDQSSSPFSNMPPPVGEEEAKAESQSLSFQVNPNDIEEISSTSSYNDPVPDDRQIQQSTNLSGGSSSSTQDTTITTTPIVSTVSSAQQSQQTIAYVLPIYECPEVLATTTTESDEGGGNSDYETGHDTALLDAAAILKYSIHRASKHNSYSGSKYDYEMIAIIHPDANQCYDQTMPSPTGEIQSLTREDQLQSLGYKTYIRNAPVNVDDIQGDYLRSNINQSSKSGIKDLIRLHAFNFVDYPVVVLLDLRSLIMKPLDDIVDVVVNGPNVNGGTTWKNLDLSPNFDTSATTIVPTRVEAAYTRDYSSISPNGWQTGVHPGLIVLKPSTTTYNNLAALIKEGDYQFNTGWGGSGIGNFPGAMTTKGILAYYYEYLNKGQLSVELNRCVYNSMADSPFIKVDGNVLCRNRIQVGSDGKTLDSSAVVGVGVGDTAAAECEDCRIRKMADLKSVNMSVCRDPWSCFHHLENMDQLRLCRNIHALWYALRNELEKNWVNYGPWGQGTSYSPAQREENGPRPEHFLGYCKSRGREGYIPMVPPVFTNVNRKKRYLRR